MKDIKEIVATNISELRKASGYTQITFSEKINYSNKTVSKWERGESTPDIETLLQLASLFGVSLQYFVEEHDQNDKVMKAKSQKPKLQLCINLLAIAFVWILSTIIFLYNACFVSPASFVWQVFLWAVPASCALLQFFNLKWYHNITYGLVLSTIFIWTLIACICLQWIELNLWLLFILGIPVQVVLILFDWMQYLSRKQ